MHAAPEISYLEVRPMTDQKESGNQTRPPKLAAVLKQLDLGRLLWRERRMLLAALAASVVAPAAAMLMPFAAKLVIDQVIGRGREELLFPIAVGAGLGLVVQAAASYGAAQLGVLSGQRIMARLRQRLQQHTMRLPSRFFDSHPSGTLVSRIITDTEQVRGLLGSGMLQLLSTAISGVLAFAVLWFINWQLTAVLAGVLLVVTLGLAVGFRRLHTPFREAAEQQAILAGRLTEVLGGILVVKTCTAERREAYRFARDSHRLLRIAVQANRQVSGLVAAIALAVGVVSLVLLVLGGQAVAARTMTLGDLALFMILAGLLSTPIIQAAAIGSELGRGVSALSRIAEVLAIPTEYAGRVLTRSAPSFEGGIVFDEVSYAYRPGHPVVRGVSFSASPGTITALTGPNGAGKSTLLGLMMGLEPPTTGRILLDGRSLSELPLAEYRRGLGVVLQQNQLFEGSIRENIQYGRPGASTAEFRRAARLARCDELVEKFPQGYETLVGERGVRLSGGERQRVAIARAILANPRILLLDEAGSQLDSEGEGLLQEALMTLCGGRTTFVVTHRLSTIRRADQILVLRSGAIVERRTHEEAYVAT
jgi:subfamily B ATP-binding cassette protein MsbA